MDRSIIRADELLPGDWTLYEGKVHSVSIRGRNVVVYYCSGSVNSYTRTMLVTLI